MASQYMGGHSDIVAGALAARREIIESIQRYERSLLGGNMDPHQAWLLIRVHVGLEDVNTLIADLAQGLENLT